MTIAKLNAETVVSSIFNFADENMVGNFDAFGDVINRLSEKELERLMINVAMISGYVKAAWANRL